jgi:hypothetical protein
MDATYQAPPSTAGPQSCRHTRKLFLIPKVKFSFRKYHNFLRLVHEKVAQTGAKFFNVKQLLIVSDQRVGKLRGPRFYVGNTDFAREALGRFCLQTRPLWRETQATRYQRLPLLAHVKPVLRRRENETLGELRESSVAVQLAGRQAEQQPVCDAYQ